MEASETIDLAISLAADVCQARQFGDWSLPRPGRNLKVAS